MGASGAWTLHTAIQLELGMLPDIARESAAFFRPGPAPSKPVCKLD